MAKYRYHQLDKNHAEIRAALERIGATVVPDGPVDLLVGHQGANYLLEVKTAKGKPNAKQEAFLRRWKGQVHVVRTVAEAFAVLGIQMTIPGRVSVIIPSRSERFLASTVRDVLAKAGGDIEILPVYEGYWDHDVPQDKRVIPLHHGTPLGMRPSINAAARIARGEWLCKLDAHCMVAERFDEILKADCGRDDVVVPRRYALDAETWTVDPTAGGGRKYPIDAHYLSYPFARIGDTACGLHGTPWTERGAARKDVLLDEEMSSQGSCWFMHRDHWLRLGELDSARYGNFIQEFQEIGLKTWLGGGRVLVNKRTWYAHLFKGKKYGRGYPMDGFRHEEGRRDFCTDYWMHDRWPERVRDLRWLVERFWPVPSWPADLDRAFHPETLAANVKAQVEAQHAAVAAKRTRSIGEMPFSILPTGADISDRDARYIGGDRKRGPIEDAGRVRHGFTRADLAREFAARGYKLGAEIGVADGRNSLTLCQNIPGLKLMCVDPWEPYDGNRRGGPAEQHDRNYGLASERLKPYGAALLKGYSAAIAPQVENRTLDFVYIDGNHAEAYVALDLELWAPKVRPGGIVAGHDFYEFAGAGVIEAVRAYTLAHGIVDWELCDEREPSFFWVKPGPSGRIVEPLPAQEDQMALKVLSADYGGKDVTAIVQKAATRDRLVIKVDNETLGGDPTPGNGKRLTVQVSSASGGSEARSAGEGRTLRIPTDRELKARK